jgi:hypothetical protein
MDCGPIEKAQVEKFKAIVKRSTKLRRRSIASSKTKGPEMFSVWIVSFSARFWCSVISRVLNLVD